LANKGLQHKNSHGPLAFGSILQLESNLFNLADNPVLQKSRVQARDRLKADCPSQWLKAKSQKLG
jgi:hypothetical protein